MAQPARIAALKQAARDHRAVEITYKSKGTEKKSTRLVRPYEIKKHGDSLVLYATEGGLKETKSFILDRIGRVVPSKKIFKPQWKTVKK